MVFDIVALLIAEPAQPSLGGHPTKCLHLDEMTCRCTNCRALVASCGRCQRRLLIKARAKARRDAKKGRR